MRILGFDITRRTKEERAADNCPNPAATDDVLWKELNPSLSGESVTLESVLSIPAVWAAVTTVANTLASLPFGLHETTPNGSELAVSHPVFDMLRLEPSEETTSFEFRRSLFAQACLGDAFARIYRNGIGRPVSLEVCDPHSVEVWQSDEGRTYYVWHRMTGSRYSREILFPRDVIHLKGFSLNSRAAISPISAHSEILGSGISSIKYGGSFFGNGAHIGGALVYPDQLTPERRKMAENKIHSKHTGVKNTGKVMVLDAGVKFEPMTLDPEKASLIGYRKLVVDDVARIFGVPAHLLGQLDRATFNNIETMNTQFVTLCLRPWAVQAEQEFMKKLLTKQERSEGRYFIRFNLDGLLRGDTQARSEYYNTMFNIGALSPNDVRAMENLNNREGGDAYFTPLNMQNSQEPQADVNTPAAGATDNNNDEGTGASK